MLQTEVATVRGFVQKLLPKLLKMDRETPVIEFF